MRKPSEQTIGLAAIVGPFALLAMQKLFVVVAVAFWLTK